MSDALPGTPIEAAVELTRLAALLRNCFETIKYIARSLLVVTRVHRDDVRIAPRVAINAAVVHTTERLAARARIAG